ncbi:hypothetical protein [Coleofasciculus sp.]|uniref:hypothetical protein n=1 Tax=Coleofasciculus sp. TaxID=3100458 RepID=UPI003A3FDCBA
MLWVDVCTFKIRGNWLLIRSKIVQQKKTEKDAIAHLPDTVNSVGAGFTNNVTVFGNNASKPALLSTPIVQKIIPRRGMQYTRSHIYLTII